MSLMKKLRSIKKDYNDIKKNCMDKIVGMQISQCKKLCKGIYREWNTPLCCNYYSHKDGNNTIIDVRFFTRWDITITVFNLHFIFEDNIPSSIKTQLILQYKGEKYNTCPTTNTLLNPVYKDLKYAPIIAENILDIFQYNNIDKTLYEYLRSHR